MFDKSLEVARALFNKEDYDLKAFVCSCVFYKQRLISVGINNNKTHPIVRYNPLICKRTGKPIHKNGSCAEWVALSKLKNTTNIPFSKMIMVNVRIKKDNSIGISRPCSSCKNLLDFFNLKEVYFTQDNGEFTKHY